MDEKYVENKIEEYNESITQLKKQNDSLIDEITLLKKLIMKSTNLADSREKYCPICGDFFHFRPFGVTPRPDAACPTCGSLERHRLLYLLLQRRYISTLKNDNIKFLHFAPEAPFYNLFKKFENIDYYPVDFSPEFYEARHIHIRDKVDMENLFYEDNTFDFIYHCHVLEHIPDDKKAMKELYRVLKKGGVCITLVPVFNIPETIEKEEYNTPELRAKYYGQADHLRKYGRDFKDRMESAGFNVEEVKYNEIVTSKMEKEIYGVGTDSVYICTK